MSGAPEDDVVLAALNRDGTSRTDKDTAVICAAFVNGKGSQLAFWDQGLLTKLAQSATLLQLEPNVTVFDEGDAVASLYMLLSGRVLIGSKTIGPRDWFGFDSVNGIHLFAPLCLERCRFVKIPHAEPPILPPVATAATPRAQIPLSGGDPGAQASGEPSAEPSAEPSPARASKGRRSSSERRSSRERRPSSEWRSLSRQSSRSSNSLRRNSKPGFKHTRQPWYAGPLPRTECERLVCAEVHGSFLVRLSSNLTSFVICVNDNGRPMHFEVQGVDGKFKFNRKMYNELTDVIEYLARKAVKGKSGKMIYLRGAQINNSSSESEEDGYNMDVGKPVDRLPTSPNGNGPDLGQSKESTLSASDLSVAVEPAAPSLSMVSRNDSNNDGVPDMPDSSASGPLPKFNSLPRVSSGSSNGMQAPAAETDPVTNTAALSSLPTFVSTAGTLKRGRHARRHHTGSRPISDGEADDAQQLPVTVMAPTSENLSLLGCRDAVTVLDETVTSDMLMVFSDTVHEALSRPAHTRSSEDNRLITDEMQHFPVFAGLSDSLRRRLCSLLEFETHEHHASVASSEEIMASWWVVVAGQISIQAVSNGADTDGDDRSKSVPDIIGIFREGECFGYDVTGPTEGMFAIADAPTCQVARVDCVNYDKAKDEGAKDTRHIEDENGNIVVVTEKLLSTDYDGSAVQVVVQGLPPKLIQRAIDPTAFGTQHDTSYTELFLMCFRTFTTPKALLSSLLGFISDDEVLVQCALSTLTMWIDKYYIDFETSEELQGGLTAVLLRTNAFVSQYSERSGEIVLRMKELEEVLLSRTSSRSIGFTLDYSTDSLGFNIRGGKEFGCGIFVSQVYASSMAEQMGLQVGDQIVNVNGTSTELIEHAKFVTIVKEKLDIELVVKFNLSGLHAASYLQQHPVLREAVLMFRSRFKKNNTLPVPPTGRINKSVSDQESSDGEFSLQADPYPTERGRGRIGSSGSRGNRHRVSGGKHRKSLKEMFRKQNDDLPIFRLQKDFNTLAGHQVIRVYRADDPLTSKHVAVATDTQSMDVMILLAALWSLPREVTTGIGYSLVQVVVHRDGKVEEKPVTDVQHDLGPLALANSRLYMISDKATEPLSTDACKAELDQRVFSSDFFLAADARAIARVMTLRDFDLFERIKPLEYIDFLWGNTSDGQTANQQAFANSCNQQTEWVIREVCKDAENPKKRAETIRKFIKIAKLCQSVNNLNGLFSIISGLISAAVSRLKLSWEKLTGKYLDLYNELEALMDPSRNMAKYRQLLEKAKATPPLIPWFPMLMKDIAFMHEGNPNKVDGLINFDKLRMMSRELRKIGKFSESPYDRNSLLPNLKGTFVRRGGASTKEACWQRAQDMREADLYLKWIASQKELSGDERMDMSTTCEPSKRQMAARMQSTESMLSEASTVDLHEGEGGGSSALSTARVSLASLPEDPTTSPGPGLSIVQEFGSSLAPEPGPSFVRSPRGILPGMRPLSLVGEEFEDLMTSENATQQKGHTGLLASAAAGGVAATGGLRPSRSASDIEQGPQGPVLTSKNSWSKSKKKSKPKLPPDSDGGGGDAGARQRRHSAATGLSSTPAPSAPQTEPPFLSSTAPPFPSSPAPLAEESVVDAPRNDGIATPFELVPPPPMLEDPDPDVDGNSPFIPPPPMFFSEA